MIGYGDFRPDPRTPVDRLAADPRVRIDTHGSWLDTEPGDDQ